MPNLVSLETAVAEIRKIAESEDAHLSKPTFKLPLTLPQPDFVITADGHSTLYYIVATHDECVQACTSFERIRKINPE
ncbi:Uncharacterised protein [uncultured archaeon]|nr:Uncharacterised protein [uncultured archaeon]